MHRRNIITYFQLGASYRDIALMTRKSEREVYAIIQASGIKVDFVSPDYDHAIPPDEMFTEPEVFVEEVADETT